jgi:hypothetical protein
LVAESDEPLSRVLDVAERLSGESILFVRRCGGGGNNRVYRIETPSSLYALKCYGSTDDRDRLGREFSGLRFLGTQDIGRSVPAAFSADREAGCALYEWIEGDPVRSHGVAEIDAALDLLRALHAVRQSVGAIQLPDATEAALALDDLEQQISRRIERLSAAASTEPHLRRFLSLELGPEFDRWLDRARSQYDGHPLDAARRTLSPSDFGFHNALRRPDGTLAFIDFEYFGWDDPVKLTADFLWHPATPLSREERLHFLAGVTDLYGDDLQFLSRLGSYFPLYGIRWALIVLNEFLPSLWERRVFAGTRPDRAAVKDAQLEKARGILGRVSSYEVGCLA